MTAAETPVPLEPVFHNLEDWVLGFFLPTFRRPLGGEFRWCAWWWKHPEAISRLRALWLSWERAHASPSARTMCWWYHKHLDEQLPILLGARGPFCACSEDRHDEPPMARIQAAPSGRWDTPSSADES